MSKHYAHCWLFRCGDDRYMRNLELRKGLEAILKDAEVEVAFGPIAPFGGSLKFRDGDFREAIKKEIPTARELGATTIIFVDHLDCAAFMKAFGELSKEDEKAKHLELLKEVNDFFAEVAPDLERKIYLQDFDNFQKIY